MRYLLAISPLWAEAIMDEIVPSVNDDNSGSMKDVPAVLAETVEAAEENEDEAESAASGEEEFGEEAWRP